MERKAFVGTRRLVVLVAALAALGLTTATVVAEETQKLRSTPKRISGDHVRRAVPGSLVVSPDLKRVAYVRASERGECLVVMGKAQRAYSRIGAVAFTVAGVVYAAQRRGKWVIVRGDRESPYEFDEIKDLATSTKADSVTCAGRQGDRWMVFKDAARLGDYDGVKSLTISPDAEVVALAVLRGGDWYCVKFTESISETAPVGYMEIGTVAVSALSKSVAYAARDEQGWSVVRMGSEAEVAAKSTRYDAIGSLALSPEDQSIAFAARQDGRWFVVTPDGPRKEYDRIGQIAFSDDGRRIAYSAHRGDEWIVVVDGLESEGYARILTGGEPYFASLEPRVLFAAERAGQLYAVQAVVTTVQQAAPPPPSTRACRGCSCRGPGGMHECHCPPHMACMM